MSYMIDFTTFRTAVLAGGTESFSGIPANSSSERVISIPTQPDTNYSIFMSHNASSQLYSAVIPSVKSGSKTTTNFTMFLWNNDVGGSANATVDWILVRNYSN